MRTPSPALTLRDRFSDQLRDAVSGVDVDSLQRTLADPALPTAGPEPGEVRFHVRDDVTELEREMTRLRFGRGPQAADATRELKGVAFDRRFTWAREVRPWKPTPPVSSASWSPARAMAPLGVQLVEDTAAPATPASEPELLHPLLAEIAALRSEIDSLRGGAGAAPSELSRGASARTTAILLVAGVLLILLGAAIVVRFVL